MVQRSRSWIVIFELESFRHLFDVADLIDEHHAALSLDIEAEEGRNVALIDYMELLTK